MNHRRLWIAFAGVILVSFAVLGWVGDGSISSLRRSPIGSSRPTGRRCSIPARFGGAERLAVARRHGVGSVWGHGSYVAPDWTADWLHREATFILDDWATPRVRPAPMTGCDGGAAGAAPAAARAT